MKQIKPLIILILAMVLIGCGGSDEISTTVTGFDKVPITGDGPIRFKKILFPATIDKTPDLTKGVLLDWAQRKFPDFFGGDYDDGTYGPYTYRYYKRTGNYIGFDGEDIYLLGPVSDGELMSVGPIWAFKCEVYSCGTYSVKSTGEYVKNGGGQQYLRTFSGLKQVGYRYGVAPTLAKLGFGAVSYRDSADSSCGVVFNSDGSVTSVNHYGSGVNRLYNYEKPSEITASVLDSKVKVLRLYSSISNNEGITIFDEEYLDIWMTGQEITGLTYGTPIKMSDGSLTPFYRDFGITYGSFCSFQAGSWFAEATRLNPMNGFWHDVISRVTTVFSGSESKLAGVYYDLNTKLPYDCLRITGPATGCRLDPIPPQ